MKNTNAVAINIQEVCPESIIYPPNYWFGRPPTPSKKVSCYSPPLTVYFTRTMVVKHYFIVKCVFQGCYRNVSIGLPMSSIPTNNELINQIPQYIARPSQAFATTYGVKALQHVLTCVYHMLSVSPHKEGEMEAYCVIGRAKGESQNAPQTTLPNGRPATRG